MASKDDEILSLLSKMIDEQRDHRSETATSFSSLDKRLELHIQKTEYELSRINDQDEVQNKLLDQHIEGVNTLKAMHMTHIEENNKQFGQVDQEIEKLKEPKKVVTAVIKTVLLSGAVVTALFGILKLIALIRG